MLRANLIASAAGIFLWFPAALAGTNFDPADYQALDGLVANQFVGTSVQIASGDFVGTVTAEDQTPNYTVRAVEIQMAMGGTMRIPASALRYNIRNRTLLTNLPASSFQPSGYTAASTGAY